MLLLLGITNWCKCSRILVLVTLHTLCRNSGTWGSPDDAKVGPTPSDPPEDQQDAKPRPEMGRPISARRHAKHNRTPEGEWVASGSNLSPGRRRHKEVPGVHGPAGGRIAPDGLARTEEDKNANVGARRQKTWAPRRRTGLGLGRWRCQRTTSTFPQRMIATAHGRAWRRISHVASKRGERGFFPPKTPPLPFRVALGRLLGL